MKRFACASVTLFMGVAGCAHSSSHYEVRVLRPLGGTVTSIGANGKPDGKIRCGSASMDGVCGPVEYENEPVTLTAKADEEFVFEAWAADCAGSGTCTIAPSEGRGVKRVVAEFEPTSIGAAPASR